MTAVATTDIGQALEYFDRTRNRIVHVTEGLSAAQWTFKPAPDRWSIAENLEHMVIIQERVLGPVREKLLQSPPPAEGTDYRALDAIIFEKIPDRSVKAKAPDHILPTGTLALDATLDRIFRNYERLAAYVETPGLRDHVLESPPIKFVTNGAYVDMDAYQWALTVAAHDERHVRQILEVKADPNYPAAQDC